jgi:hypothetical protein
VDREELLNKRAPEVQEPHGEHCLVVRSQGYSGLAEERGQVGR